MSKNARIKSTTETYIITLTYITFKLPTIVNTLNIRHPERSVNVRISTPPAKYKK